MNAPAFPHPAIRDRIGQIVAHEHPGMTMLDFFAIEALKGILSDADHEGYKSPEKRVELAWRYAALMMQSRPAQ